MFVYAVVHFCNDFTGNIDKERLREKSVQVVEYADRSGGLLHFFPVSSIAPCYHYVISLTCECKVNNLLANSKLKRCFHTF